MKSLDLAQDRLARQEINPAKDIYFVIVNYYSTALIQQLLKSLAVVSNTEFNSIIVNNSPEDTAVKQLTADFPNLILIEAETNLGFGAGCNLGIQQVYQLNPKALVWLINPDTTVDSNAIDYVIECLKNHPELAILGTKIRDTQGNLWFDVGQFNPWVGSLKHNSKQSKNQENLDKIIPSRWVSGCSLILNLARFNECPQFDPHYFLYYEDNDLCERYYKQGYPIAVTPEILVTHVISATSQSNQLGKFRHATYSKLYFLNQHGTKLALGLNLAYIMAKILGLSIKGDRTAAKGRWQGLKQFIFNQKHG